MANVATRVDIFPQSIQAEINETLNLHSQTDRGELTKREQEVLQIMSLGWNDQKAANVLNISLYTYRAHRRNILNKFNAKNQIEAIVRAFRSKLIH